MTTTGAMTTLGTADALAPGAGPLWVSIEGINGVGKTSAAQTLAATWLGTRCVVADELTDCAGDLLHQQVMAALTERDDPFLRTGHPVVETLALLALQVGKAERLAGRDLTGVEVIIEDRGVDSVAVYQAAILCAQRPGTSPETLARHVLASVRPWWRIPDATILLTGDPRVCARRFSERIGQPLAPADLCLIDQIDAGYRALAADDRQRYTVVDAESLSQSGTVAAVHKIVATYLDRRTTHA